MDIRLQQRANHGNIEKSDLIFLIMNSNFTKENLSFLFLNIIVKLSQNLQFSLHVVFVKSYFPWSQATWMSVEFYFKNFSLQILNCIITLYYNFLLITIFCLNSVGRPILDNSCTSWFYWISSLKQESFSSCKSQDGK